MITNNSITTKSRQHSYILPSLTGRGLGVDLWLFLLLALFCACSSYDNDDNSSNSDNGNNGTTYTVSAQADAPQWQIDWSYNQERPNWKQPDHSLYENSTPIKVELEETLRPYVAASDMMALFVNNELHGFAHPAVIMDNEQEVSNKFLMKAYGNETDAEQVNVSLKYYSETLKHIFSLSDHLSFNADKETGFNQAYIPPFTNGSAKFPVVKTVAAESLLTSAGITPVSGCLVGAFVGEECRGKATLSANGNTPMTIYGRTAGEPVTLKYYDAATGQLFTIADALKL